MMKLHTPNPAIASEMAVTWKTATSATSTVAIFRKSMLLSIRMVGTVLNEVKRKVTAMPRTSHIPEAGSDG